MTDEKVETPSKAAVQSRSWRENNRERYLSGIKKANDERRKDPEKWAKKLEQNRVSAKKHKEKRNAYAKTRDKLKLAARRAIRNRIYRGYMKRGSCDVCGVPNADAHHANYSKPLEVRWLCRKHHAEAHHE
jgi:hypothetical protein